MGSEETEKPKPRTTAEVVDKMISLMLEFNYAFTFEQKIMAGRVLDDIYKTAQEGIAATSPVGYALDDYAIRRKFSMLLPYAIEAMRHVNTPKGMKSNWGAVTGQKCTMEGLTFEMRRQSYKALPAPKPEPAG